MFWSQIITFSCGIEITLFISIWEVYMNVIDYVVVCKFYNVC